MHQIPNMPSAEEVASLPPSDILDLMASLATCHPDLYTVEALPTGSFLGKSKLFPSVHSSARTANDALWKLEEELQSFLLDLLPHIKQVTVQRGPCATHQSQGAS